MSRTIILDRHRFPVEVTLNGRCIAYTRRALRLEEPGYPARFYVPREDVDMGNLERTSRVTRCPFKGEAAYYTVLVDGETEVSAAWTYEQPVEGMESIRDHICFDDSGAIEVDGEAGGRPSRTADLRQFPTAPSPR